MIAWNTDGKTEQLVKFGDEPERLSVKYRPVGHCLNKDCLDPVTVNRLFIL